MFNTASHPRRPIRLVAWEVMIGIRELACRLWIPGVVVIRPIAWAMHRRRWFWSALVVLFLLAGLQYNNWELPELATIPKSPFFQKGKLPQSNARPVQASFLTSLASIAPQPTLADTTVITLWFQVKSEGLADGWAGVRDDQAFYMALMTGAENKDDIVAFARNRKAIWKGLAGYRTSFPGGDPIKPLLADGKK